MIRSGPSRSMVDPSGRPRAHPFLMPLVAVAIVAFLLWFHVGKSVEPSELDGDLCPTDPDEIAVSAIFLVDLQKPLHDPSALGAILRRITLELDAGAELRVVALAGNPELPTYPVDRLCKPYDNSDLSVESAKDQRRTFRDCEDLPAQLAPGLRALASRFCSRRGDLEKRVRALAARAAAPPIANAYLAEALEETLRAFARRPGTPSLYVYSDMLQHADWYSQLELGWTGWRFDEFASRRAAPRRSYAATDLRAKIFYVPRRGLTEPPRAKRVHQQFWRDFFDGVQTVFEDQPPLPSYAAVTLMNLADQTESAAREREELHRRRLEAESQLAEVSEEIEALKRERQRREARESERIQRERELRRREQTLESERQRLPEEELQSVSARPASDEPRGAARPASDEPRGASQSAMQPPGTATVPAPVSRPVPEAQAPPPCDLRLQPRYTDVLTANRYPTGRRVNYGGATVAVRYAVDRAGATVDEEVVLVAERSSAVDARYFDALARDTLNVVQAWTFDFPTGGEEACVRRQERIATFDYVQKCRGAPMPSCQTVVSDVDYR